MQSLIGTGVAIITPFRNDFSVDIEALQRIVNFVIDGGVEYLVVLGTTGEASALNKQEKEIVIQAVKDANNHRVGMVLGIGGNNTAEVIEEILHADLSDFDAILSVSPYYNKPSQEGIYQHFKAIAQVSPKPIILYNVPGRTASNMLPSTVARLAKDFDNIIGIKEASGDIVQAMKLLKLCPKDFLVISGDDMVTLPIVLAGGAGVISVIADGFPKEFSEMVRLALNKKSDEAYKLHYKLMDIIEMIFEQGNPSGIKEVFKHFGLCENIVRLPLVEVDKDLSNRILKYIKTATLQPIYH